MWGWLQVTSGRSRALAAWTSPGFQCQMKWGNQLPHTNLPKPNDQFTFFHKKSTKFEDNINEGTITRTSNSKSLSATVTSSPF